VIGQLDSIPPLLKALDQAITNSDSRHLFEFLSADFARLQGRLDDATRFATEGEEQMQRAGASGTPLQLAAMLAFNQAWFRGDGPGAQRRLDEALARTPLRSIPMTEAPYEEFVRAYVLSGRADRARAIAAEWGARRHEAPTTRDTVLVHRFRGAVALADRDYATAQSELRITETFGCVICDLPLLGRAFDLGGVPDSVIAVYERFIGTKLLDRGEVDGAYLPAIHKRLGELYEAKGQRDKALQHYRIFIELWKNADPALQPKVTDAKQRVAGLVRGTDARKQ
jgi:tetratricopeptide (TPR) repeat protein